MSVMFLLLLSSSSLCDADQFDDTYFDQIRGSWVGDGELMDSAGVTTAIHEEWTAESEGERFLIQGTRLSGEENQEFRWIFTFNASTEFYECSYWHTGMETEMTFEVSLNGSTAELRTPFGDSGGELLVSNSVEGDTIDGFVEISGGNGEVFPLAKIKHTKRED